MVNKKEFLTQLERQLSGISNEEKKDILYDYEEHFRIGLENGRTEAEISKSLGSPRIIAKQLKATQMLQAAEQTASASNIFKAVIASLSLGFFNLVFVLGPFLGLAGVLLGLFGVGIGLTFGGIAAFIGSVFEPMLPTLLVNEVGTAIGIFLSFGLTSLGLLIIIGDCYLTKFFYQLIIKYLKFNYKIITGRRFEYEN